MGLEVVVGFVVAWAINKARRVASRADGAVDVALDAGVDYVIRLVLSKLQGDSAVSQLQAEAARTGEVAVRTRTRVQLALEDAIARDPAFAAELNVALTGVRIRHDAPPVVGSSGSRSPVACTLAALAPQSAA